MNDTIAFEWDEAKRQLNLINHDVDFADAEKLNWVGALTFDQVHAIEIRHLSCAPIGDRLYAWYGHKEVRSFGLSASGRRTPERLQNVKKPSKSEDAMINAAMARDSDTWEAPDFSRARRGRPFAKTPKLPVSIRLDANVVEYFRTNGKGWQSEINLILSKHVRRQKLTDNKTRNDGRG